jgi:chromate transporter
MLASLYKTIDVPGEEAAGDVSLKYLFHTFFKIGLVSFGGHMGLIAVVQRVMSDRDKRVSHDTILEGVSLASLLPGPLAVNVVAYIGYQLRGRTGALVSVLGVLLPACTAMLLLSWLYLDYAHRQHIPELLYYTTGAVSAIILSTGIRLFTKEIQGSHPLKYGLCIITAGMILFVSGYWVTIGMILAGAAAGACLPVAKKGTAPSGSHSVGLRTLLCLSFLVGCALQFLVNAQRYAGNMLIRLASVFSGISLTLFGGGYVMIPLMQSILVDNLHWLTRREFIDAIAFSQATPGPVLVSATFVGYKLAGLTGAILATLSIFLPSALLMICLSRVFTEYKEHYLLKNILAGIKAVVVGMILATAVKIIGQSRMDALMGSVTLLSFILSYRFNVSPVFIMLGTVLMGLLLIVIKQGI